MLGRFLLMFEQISYRNDLFSLNPGFILWRNRLSYLSSLVFKSHFLFICLQTSFCSGHLISRSCQWLNYVSFLPLTFSFCQLLHILFIFIVIRYFICWAPSLFVTYHLILFSFGLKLTLSNVFFLYCFPGEIKRKYKTEGKTSFLQRAKANLNLWHSVFFLLSSLVL